MRPFTSQSVLASQSWTLSPNTSVYPGISTSPFVNVSYVPVPNLVVPTSGAGAGAGVERGTWKFMVALALVVGLGGVGLV